MKKIEKYIQTQMGGEWKKATPSLVIQAYHKGKKIADMQYGKKYKYYDIASLTKCVFTNSAFMSLQQNREKPLEMKLAKVLPWVTYKNLKLEQLLKHHSGFSWWNAFYMKLSKGKRFEDPVIQWQKLRLLLQKEKNHPIAKAVYSDIDYLFLGCALEEIYQAPLETVWLGLQEKMQLENTNFHVGNKPLHKKSLYAPTERCSWRKRMLQGEVHDENAWSLGGVSSHAGLFSTKEDMEKYFLLLRKSYRDGSKVFSKNTLRLFTKRAMKPSVGDWSHGFMLPTKGSSSCGKYFSPESFGHTGFTGTSLWYDPKKDLGVVLLSNRVHPTRENKTFVTLRPQIHNWIVEGLVHA